MIRRSRSSPYVLYRSHNKTTYNGNYVKLTEQHVDDYDVVVAALCSGTMPCGWRRVSKRARIVLCYLTMIRDLDLPTRRFLTPWIGMGDRQMKSALRECIDAGLVVAYSLVLDNPDGRNRKEGVAYRLITHLVEFKEF